MTNHLKPAASFYRKRIHDIVVSYHLAGDDGTSFEGYLAQLMERFPLVLLELALVETLVRQWLQIPFEKGVAFLQCVHGLLHEWQAETFQCHLTPAYFEMITGLDAAPVFDRLSVTLYEWQGAWSIARATVQTPATEIL
jgi:hypothetical protein